MQRMMGVREVWEGGTGAGELLQEKETRVRNSGKDGFPIRKRREVMPTTGHGGQDQDDGSQEPTTRPFGPTCGNFPSAIIQGEK